MRPLSHAGPAPAAEAVATAAGVPLFKTLEEPISTARPDGVVLTTPNHYFNDNPWREQAGGGPILLVMIHEAHNLHVLCGEIVINTTAKKS